MESLFGLAILILIGIPVSIVYLLVSNTRLKRRVSALEAGLSGEPQKALEDQDRPAQSEKPGPWERPDLVAVLPQAPVPEATPEPPVAGPPKAVVFNAQKLAELTGWMMQNWFYVVSAASLALAGIFLVQYGMERGLLPPSVRILAALAFGAALVVAGEFIRRRYGDDEDSTTAYLPSTFSGAGIVTLFSAIVSARLLYGFIGAETTLIGMALVGALALVLGWFYGPLLAAIGVIGAMVAPFVVGGSSGNPSWLLAYFMIVTMVGLAIDTMRRWAWVSVVSLVLGFGAGFLLMQGASFQTAPYFVIYCAVLALAAIAIPVRRLTPDHDGTALSLAIISRQVEDTWPTFPTRLAGGAVIAASGLIVFALYDVTRPDVFWTSTIVLTGLTLALLVWARNAPAISDLAAVPAVALILVVADGLRVWQPLAEAAKAPEADMPMMVSILVAIGVLISAVAAWRSLLGGAAQLFIACGAAIFAPTIAIVLEVILNPSLTLGPYIWALHAMAIAAFMVIIAERFARADGPEDRLRFSVALLSALACITFGMVILFSTAALTVALAVTIVVAAWLDRQFNLPLMGVYILAGITAVGYRLTFDPGIAWATEAPLFEMLLSHGGAVLAFAASWTLVGTIRRPRSAVLLESALFSSTGILISVLFYRAIVSWSGENAALSHWSMGIAATVWLVLGMTQLRRVAIDGSLAWLRTGLGTVFLAMGFAQILFGLTLANPLFQIFNTAVLGPALFNTLIPAYLLPATVLALGAQWVRVLPRQIKIGFLSVSVALAVFWLALTIRHFWRGAAGMELPFIGQPELYSYTVALLLAGCALFYQSLARHSPILRKAGLLVIGLAVAKVFLVDISGLGGLIRVFSLLFLGLALAALAWLNRWASEKTDKDGGSSDGTTGP